MLVEIAQTVHCVVDAWFDGQLACAAVKVEDTVEQRVGNAHGLAEDSVTELCETLWLVHAH